MCGISGLVNCGDRGTLTRMTSVQAHRGPDDFGLWERRFPDGGYVGLGSRRLAIIDLSPSGHMPMCNEDRTVWITYNGEIYNFTELRRELLSKGHHFISDTDTEVVIHLYEEEGPECVKRLNGMFAFALCDLRSGTPTLFLARDHFGVKPFYYAHTGRCLAFASEIKALLEVPGIEAQLDPESLHQYLTFLWVPDDLITGKTPERFLRVVITYPEHAGESQELHLVKRKTIAGRRGAESSGEESNGEQSLRIGVLGAGAFALGTLLPALKRAAAADLIGVCAASGSHARHAAEKFGFRYCATDEQRILDDAEVNTVVIATRHHLHAAQVLAAIKAGKNIFCEKPLCLSEIELAETVQAYRGQAFGRNPVLMVGFNRRFAPMALRMKEFLAESSEPLAMHYRVNAGCLAPDHWVNDPEQGGGRILSEVCHFVDFLSLLAGAPPIEVQTRSVDNLRGGSNDDVIVSLQFPNGSHGTISYLTGGDRTYSKERLEVFGGGAAAVLEDLHLLELVRHGRKQRFRLRFRQDKGHRAELEAFTAAVRTGSESPIPFDEIVAVTLATLRAAQSRSSQQPVMVDAPSFIHSHSSSRRPA